MKKINYILASIGFLMLFGLVYWQVRQLDANRQWKQENQLQEMKSKLFEIAVDFKKKQVNDSLFRLSTVIRNNFLDSTFSKTFKEFTPNYNWKIENYSEEIIDTTSRLKTKLNRLSVCLSCLILKERIDKSDSLNEDNNFIIKYTPEQIIEMKGLNKSELKFLNIYFVIDYRNFNDYIIPFLFLFGLVLLISWMVYLNVKQSKLIKQKNEFVNHLSHQFQTPLASIRMGVNILDKKGITNNKEIIQIIQNESNRLENHIKTVLHWVKSDADRLKLYKKKISLTDIIEQCLKQMKPVFFANNTVVHFIPSENEHYLNVDNDHLQLMLFNLWENAIKHNDQSIKLTISIFKTKKYIEIESKDNGVGIQDVNNTIKFKGLGLSYVRKIMKMHNGELILESVRENGLNAKLKFPVDG